MPRRRPAGDAARLAAVADVILVPPPLASSHVWVVSIGNGPSEVLITSRRPGSSSATS
jgi:NADPH-dependent glutamate synthase beta subunit-like oxidoreductase